VRIGLFVVLLGTILVAVLMLPVEPELLAAAPSAVPPAGLAESCFAVRVADSRFATYYPDSIQLTREPTGSPDSTRVVRALDGDVGRMEWRVIRGDSLELRRYHEPTVRLKLGEKITGTMRLPWTRSLFSVAMLSDRAQVVLERTACPKHSRATG
jgi:hypothetical protein